VDTAPTGRSQHALYVVPEDPGTAATVLGAALEHDGPVLILTADVESAVSLADVVLALHPDRPVLAATSTARARRVARDATVIVGTPATVLGLVRATALKLDPVRSLVVAWADLADADLEALMAEVPKEASRTIVVSAGNPAVEAFVERYARRPRRVGGDEAVSEPAAPTAIRYVTTAAATRPAALRRLLDEIDPPSAIVHVHSSASEHAVRATLRVLGYAGDDAAVRVARGPATVNTTQLVVLYDVPLDAAELHAATAGSPVHVVALVEPRQLPRLRALAAVAPLTLSGPTARARTREATLRDELRATLEAGVPSRELIALEPLLAEFDGIELAAAALHLLDRARSTVVVVQAPAPAPAPIAAPPRPFIERSRGRDDRPPRRDDRPARRDDRPAKRPFTGGPRKARDDRPRPAGAGGPPSRDKRSGPPRSEWAERGERLTHSRRPAPRNGSGGGRGRPPARGE